MVGGTRRVVDPARLGEAARRQLTDELYALNERIFEGVSRDRFVHHVIAPPAQRTRILLRRNARGELIGYCAAHLFALSVSGRRYLVFRAEAGMLAPYRGSGGTFLFGLRQALACRLRHPCTPLFLFCTLIHPSSYLLLARHLHTLYPHSTAPAAPDACLRRRLRGGPLGLRRSGTASCGLDHPGQRGTGSCLALQ